jgi:hypothetical protein
MEVAVVGYLRQIVVVVIIEVIDNEILVLMLIEMRLQLHMELVIAG